MTDLGLGRYVCPNKHGEWLVDESELGDLGVEIDSDPYRHEKTIASQLREYGSNADRAGKAKKKPHKLRRWEVE